jgi:hypothetical protein
MGQAECIHVVVFGWLYLASPVETRCCLVVCTRHVA